MKIIETYKGATCLIKFTCLNDLKEPQDLTNGSLAIIIKTNKTDTDANAKHYEIKTIFDNPSTGIQYFEITDDKTATLKEGEYFGQFRYIDAAGKTDFSIDFLFRIIKGIYES